MDFEFTEEQKMLREAVRSFAAKEIAPLVDEAEDTETFPVQLFPMMGDLDYLCLCYSPDYGAAGMGKIGDCIVTEEVAYHSVGIAAGTMVQAGIGTAAIDRYGSEEQKHRYLVPAIKGRKVAAFGLTEPNVGSDASAVETKAIRKNGTYILNGTKTFITNGSFSDFVTVVAYTDKSKGPKGGMSLFVVEAGTKGFNRSKLHKFCAYSSEVAELNFDDCAVPEENLVGEEGKGLY